MVKKLCLESGLFNRFVEYDQQGGKKTHHHRKGEQCAPPEQ
jgi:hypothetical protein